MKSESNIQRPPSRRDTFLIMLMAILIVGPVIFVSYYCAPKVPKEGFFTKIFYITGESTVVDLKTGLMWQQKLFAERFGKSLDHLPEENITLGGYNDWRVPSSKELLTLYDNIGEARDILKKKACAEKGFKHILSVIYWYFADEGENHRFPPFINIDGPDGIFCSENSRRWKKPAFNEKLDKNNYLIYSSRDFVDFSDGERKTKELYHGGQSIRIEGNKIIRTEYFGKKGGWSPHWLLVREEDEKSMSEIYNKLEQYKGENK
ncbi:MAG: DUF1566 domain-containing protein [Candidatus Omnitrophica bacterium]|nr:DUF1566 domain-containing protein [Candidatus Omnitrophota bacterium]